MLLIVPNVFADGTAPERLYLVGSMNYWMLPSENDNADLYSLTDEDGDGIYEGSFVLNEVPDFKIFKDKDADWTSTESYFGADAICPLMYSDREWRVSLPSAASYYYGMNINIRNWAGGTLTLKAHFESDDELILEASGTNQPTFPICPDNIYLIGSFNDYKLPDADSDNGALAIPLADSMTGDYSGAVKLPEGNVEFKVYIPPFSLYEDGLQAGVSSGYAPVFLARPSEDDTCVKTISLNYYDESCYPAVIGGWNGTEINFTYNAIEPILLDVEAPDAPVVEPLTEMYMVWSADGGEKQIAPMTKSSISMYDMTVDLKGFDGEKLEVIFTRENSVTPAVYYGAPAELSEGFSFTGEPIHWYAEDLYAAENTSPLLFNLNDEFTWDFSYRFNAVANYVSVTASAYTPSVYDELYLIGALGGGGDWDIFDENRKLEKIEKNVFYGEFPVLIDTPTFRFYTSLGDWDAGSVGSQSDDMPITITLPYAGHCEMGKGSWAVDGFEGDIIKITVNLNTFEVFFISESSSVEEIYDGARKIIGIYDLSGSSRKSLCSGVNIVRYSDGTVSKVIR